MSTRDSMISAILEYFGSDSDIYKKAMSGQGLTVGEMNAVLSSIPYMEPVTSISGKRLGIDVNVPFKDVNPDREWLQSLLDSNQGGASYSGSFSGNIPGDFTFDPNTNTYTAISGAKDSLGNIVPVIADKVSLAVTGVNIGAKLGYAIDKTLYDNFPDFWRDVFGNVTPQDFANLFSEDTFGNRFMRTLFGIKDGDMIPYISEDAISLYYQALRDSGAFNKPNITYIPTSGPISNVPTTGGSNTIVGQYSYSYHLDGDCVCFSANQDLSYPYLISFSKTPTTFTGWRMYKDDPNYKIRTSGSSYTYNNRTVYYTYLSTGFSSTQPYIGSCTYFRDLNYYNYGPIAWTLAYGEKIENPTITGISKLPETDVPYGYPDPAIVDGSTLPDILSQLKQNYPDYFQNPLTISTPQPDGTISTTTYYPVPWATSLPSPDTSTQVSPQQQTKPITKTDVKQDVDTLSDEEIVNIVPHSTPDPVVTPKVEPNSDPEVSSEPAPFPDAPAIPPTDTVPPDTGEGDNEKSPLPIGTDNAMWAVYNPSNSTLNEFGAWLWSPDFIDNILRLFQSPIDGIIGVHKIFVTPPRGGTQNIVVGYLDSGVPSVTVPSQYAECDCGSIDLPEYFGNVFDYAPYTDVSIYLPFIGITKLDVADIMRSKISVKYRCDVYTGACLALINIKRDGFEPTMYTFAGDCAVHYPTSAGSYSGIISSVISAGVSALASGMATGGNFVMGSIAAGTTFLTHNKGLSVEHSGGLSGNSGAMGHKKPYLIIKRPQIEMAVDANLYDGIPANYTTAVASCSGYIKCKIVHLKIPGAYQVEINEIEQLLKSGILISDD